MFSQKERLERELVTIDKMVKMYCAAHHKTSGECLCDECAGFMDYMVVRLQKCPYGKRKPTCSNCPIKCYKKLRKEQGRAIMMYSGPRMLLRHPLLTIAHKLDGMIKVRHPRELTRDERLQSRRKAH